MKKRSIVRAALCAALLAVAVPQGVADAARPRPDRTPPSTPANFRVTGTTQTSVSFAWNPSTDNVRVVSYSVGAPPLAGGNSHVAFVNHPTTSATVTGLHPGATYQFRVQSFDGIQPSPVSAPLPVTTRPDTSAPTTPTGLTLHAVDSPDVQLRWNASTDDFGPVTYRVLVDGVASPNTVSIHAPGTFPAPSIQGVWVRQLDPGAHTFTVQAVDSGRNASVPTSTVSATIAPNADTVAPTTPTLQSASSGGQSYCPEELHTRWTPSTDNVTPAADIDYEVRINGSINEVVPWFSRHIGYTDIWGANTVTIVAVDQAGNASAPSNAITENIQWGAGCGT